MLITLTMSPGLGFSFEFVVFFTSFWVFYGRISSVSSGFVFVVILAISLSIVGFLISLVFLGIFAFLYASYIA